MSAVAHWQEPVHLVGTREKQRRHLELVPPLRVRGIGSSSGAVLTMRGRRVVAAVVLALMLLAGWGIGRALAGGGSSYSQVTVQPGQTLSQIAHAALPAIPVSEAVVQVQSANDLNSSQVHAGQQLRIPR